MLCQSQPNGCKHCEWAYRQVHVCETLLLDVVALTRVLAWAIWYYTWNTSTIRLHLCTNSEGQGSTSHHPHILSSSCLLVEALADTCRICLNQLCMVLLNGSTATPQAKEGVPQSMALAGNNKCACIWSQWLIRCLIFQIIMYFDTRCFLALLYTKTRCSSSNFNVEHS